MPGAGIDSPSGGTSPLLSSCQACSLLSLPQWLLSLCPFPMLPRSPTLSTSDHSRVQGLEERALGWDSTPACWPGPLSRPQFTCLRSEAPPRSPSRSGCVTPRHISFSANAEGCCGVTPNLLWWQPHFKSCFYFHWEWLWARALGFQFLADSLLPVLLRELPHSSLCLPGPRVDWAARLRAGSHPGPVGIQVTYVLATSATWSHPRQPKRVPLWKWKVHTPHSRAPCPTLWVP